MDDQGYSAENPYAAPPIDADLAMVNAAQGLDPAQDELIRREYLSHEASVRSVGLLYYAGAFFFGVGALGIASFLLLPELLSPSQQGPAPIMRVSIVEVIFVAIVVVLYGGMAVLMFFTAGGLRRLQPWARISSGILSAIGLLSFPVGTLINGYILYLLFSRKGQVVFTPEYRDTIDRTPHIKYKTSIIVKILAGILLALLLLGIVAAIVAG